METERHSANDSRILKWLDDIKIVDEEKYQILSLLREKVFEIFPQTKERMQYGGIMFSLNGEDYSGLFLRKHHISFEFSFGVKMVDSFHFLEGQGAYRRHLKIRSLEEIQLKKVDFYLNQAI